MDNNNMNDSIQELHKLIQLVDEDSSNIDLSQAISDYLVPILTSMLGEIEANRQYILQNADRTNLAILMSEKTFLGEILTGIADHFSTIAEALKDTPADSKLGVALAETHDLLATWMSFDISDDDDSDDDDSDDDDSDDEDDSDDDDSDDDIDSDDDDSSIDGVVEDVEP